MKKSKTGERTSLLAKNTLRDLSGTQLESVAGGSIAYGEPPPKQGSEPGIIAAGGVGLENASAPWR
ncbi:MAG TPA: hypothetical protein VHW23_26875 [Kofleriaceae bacterium]|jgi:hypothetical protein|nr:hypothetical protein [Kofleriaceae bacterium]